MLAWGGQIFAHQLYTDGCVPLQGIIKFMSFHFFQMHTAKHKYFSKFQAQISNWEKIKIYQHHPIKICNYRIEHWFLQHGANVLMWSHQSSDVNVHQTLKTFVKKKEENKKRYISKCWKCFWVWNLMINHMYNFISLCLLFNKI